MLLGGKQDVAVSETIVILLVEVLRVDLSFAFEQQRTQKANIYKNVSYIFRQLSEVEVT